MHVHRVLELLRKNYVVVSIVPSAGPVTRGAVGTPVVPSVVPVPRARVGRRLCLGSGPRLEATVYDPVACASTLGLMLL